MCIENSRLLNFVYDFLVNEGGRTFSQVKTVNLKKLPIILPNENSNQKFELFASQQLNVASNYSTLLSDFKKYLKLDLSIEKLSRKLQNWHELEVGDFINELNKAIKKAGGTPLTKKDEFEWLELFEDNKKKAQDLQTQIIQTEKTIDTMVYELYGLTQEEIEIVENS